MAVMTLQTVQRPSLPLDLVNMETGGKSGEKCTPGDTVETIDVIRV
jgi:hypothetical protein